MNMENFIRFKIMNLNGQTLSDYPELYHIFKTLETQEDNNIYNLHYNNQIGDDENDDDGDGEYENGDGDEDEHYDDENSDYDEECMCNSKHLYENANQFIKKKIITPEHIYLYNYWCCRIMCECDDFCGKFNMKFLKYAYETVEDDMIEFINEESDENVKFFIEIFKPLICSFYNNELKKASINSNKILKSFTKVNSHDDCTICMEKLNGKISVKTQCNHIMHRKCLKTWLAESHTCPVCRSKLEEIKIDKNK